MGWIFDILAAIGAVVAVVGIFLALVVAWQIAGNIYGGILGAYRLRRFMMGRGSERLSHTGALRFGLRAWGGQRYRNGVGHAYRIGNLLIPVDGRDPIVDRIPA